MSNTEQYSMDRDTAVTTGKGGGRNRDARIIVGVSLLLAVIAVVAFMATLPS